MEEPYTEGLASHGGPESCVGRREAAGEALTGARVGWVLSREIYFWEPTLFADAEGNTGGRDSASGRPTWRGRRPHAMRGTSMHENREILDLPATDGVAGGIGKAEATSRCA
jgi:hypothetical protein